MQNAITSRKSQKLLKTKTDFNRDHLADLLESLISPIREANITLGAAETALSMGLRGTLRTKDVSPKQTRAASSSASLRSPGP